MKVKITSSNQDNEFECEGFLNTKEGTLSLDEKVYEIFEYSFYGDSITVRTNDKKIFRGFVL